MTEEEKKAIEYVEQFIGIEKQYKYKPIKIKTLKNTRLAIQTILNLIQKKDSEIKKLNNVIDRMAEYIYSKTDFTTCGNIKSIKEYFINNK